MNSALKPIDANEAQHRIHGRVLLVEDDPQLRDTLSQQLMSADLSVRAVANAGSFLAALVEDRLPYDVAIIDLNLPDLNGDQLVSWMKEGEEAAINDLSVIILTGSPNLIEPWLEDARNIHCILFKPCPMKLLLECVQECLRG